jgi:hypothetical protein
VANELQNSSSTATDTLGNPRLTLATGTAATPVTNAHSGGLDGFRGTIGTVSGEGVTGTGETGNAAEVQGTLPGDTQYSGSDPGKGSGHQGGSRHGRRRLNTKIGADVFGSVAARPRQLNYQNNSILTFQKVLDYTIAADGSPNIIWGAPITYQVQNNRLARPSRTWAPSCSRW